MDDLQRPLQTLPDGFADRARALLGPNGATDDPDLIAPLVKDWRGRFTGRTPLLCRPANTEEAAGLVRLCAEAGVRVTPQGGNTGLVNGGIPYGEVLVSTSRMRAIRAVDAGHDSLTVDAGVTLSAVHEAAEAVGRLFPRSLGSQGVATVGGLVSTNAGGTAVLRYGMMRDLVLGLEVVTADGRVWNGLKGLRKDNTGYDLKQLFIGAEGTLGLVTAATLKLFAQPRAVATGWAAVQGPREAVSLLSLAKERSGGAVTGFELMPRHAIDLVAREGLGAAEPLAHPAPWRVLIELSLSTETGAQNLIEDILSAGMEAGLVEDALIAQSKTQADGFWSIRETIPLAEKAAGVAVKHDVSTPVSVMPDFFDEASAAALKLAPEAHVIAFGHVGDGNLHFNIALAKDAPGAEAFLAKRLSIQNAVHDVAAKYGGSISAEHGVGLLKAEEIARRKAGVEMDMMRAVKAALDPQGLFNPGRVIA